MESAEIFRSDINDKEALLKEFLSQYDYFNDEDRERISKAWYFMTEKCGDKKRSCGTPYYLHPLRLAKVLADSKLDADAVITGILHTIRDFGVSPEEIGKTFGEQIEKLLQGTNKIMYLPINSKTLRQADAIRKMIFAMVDDVRIILVKIADRLDRIRNIKSLEPERQRILAEEIIDIWAPLADRLGMQTAKNEFEDLSLRYTNPKAYNQIEAIVAQSKEERAEFLNSAVKKIQQKAEKAGISVTITSRAKHFYSIYQKMRKRNKSASELYDLLALRILCNSNAECYQLVGIVHSLWLPMDGRFKDYIAVPKANGYQSLHTTVICEGKPLEIQIRTYEMHNMAEHGIASHWLYKKGTNHDLVEADKLEIFNKLQSLKESILTNGADFETLKNELLGDEIFVFTPAGDVKNFRPALLQSILPTRFTLQLVKKLLRPRQTEKSSRLQSPCRILRLLKSSQTLRLTLPKPSLET
ncbi:Guanosine polyphosphate pyrophosphohydrolase/synthetase [Treponema sp. JC4]|nr:Guanosine polyphosphate pyrophosphohydrolase/synthetase [Treponema sp. JC4]